MAIIVSYIINIPDVPGCREVLGGLFDREHTSGFLFMEDTMSKNESEERKEEIVDTFTRDKDYKIIKKTGVDGEAHYYHPLGSELENICKMDLYDIFIEPINRFKSLVNMLDDEEYNNFGFLADALIEASDVLYDEVFYFIEKNIGTIEFDVIERNCLPYRAGRIIGVRVKKENPEVPTT